MKHVIAFILFTFFTSSAFSQCDDTLTESEKNQLYESDKLEVMGLVDRPTILTIDSLKKLNVYTSGPFHVKSRTGDVRQEFKSFKAVLLKEIVKRAGIKIENASEMARYNYEKGSYYIVLTATNGYRVMYTYNELMFTTVGDHAMVLFEGNGKEITTGGKIMGFCTTDTITGARNIWWMKSIEVCKLADGVSAHGF